MAKCKVGSCTPQQAGAAWNTGFSAGAANAKKTIDAGNVQWASPTMGAESQIASGIAAAFASGRWRQGVQRTGDAGWRTAMQQKGIPHMAAGSAAGQQHYATFRQQWDPAVMAMMQSLPLRGGYEQNKARATAMIDAMHAQKGKFKGLWKGGMAGG